MNMKIIISESQENTLQFESLLKKQDLKGISEYLKKRIPFLKNNFNVFFTERANKIHFQRAFEVENYTLLLHGHPVEFKTFNVTIDFTFQLAYYDKGIALFNLHNYFYAKPNPEKLNDLMRRIHHMALKNISEKKYDYSGEYPKEDLDEIFNDINKRFFNLEQDWEGYFTESL